MFFVLALVSNINFEENMVIGPWKQLFPRTWEICTFLNAKKLKIFSLNMGMKEFK